MFCDSMNKTEANKSEYYTVSGNGEGIFTVHFRGKLDIRSSAVIINDLIPEINSLSPASLAADIDDISYIDDFGLIILAELKKTIKTVLSELSTAEISRGI
jgi:anti-anti-sigma factor